MKEKKKKWFEDSIYSERVRYHPKWKEKIRQRYKGKSMAERFDKALEELFSNK